MEKIATDKEVTEDEATEKTKFSFELGGFDKKWEDLLEAKIRSIWLKEGDKNTKFFHKIANAHKRYHNV